MAKFKVGDVIDRAGAYGRGVPKVLENFYQVVKIFNENNRKYYVVKSIRSGAKYTLELYYTDGIFFLADLKNLEVLSYLTQEEVEGWLNE
jgi:hypothetical protein